NMLFIYAHVYCTTIPLLYWPSPLLRDLPSFPTRRSSDLVTAEDDPAAYARRQLEQLSDSQPLQATEALGETGPLVGDEVDPGARSEEHSLNSSHVKISYAVFCLKKKKRKKTIQTSSAKRK